METRKKNELTPIEVIQGVALVLKIATPMAIKRITLKKTLNRFWKLLGIYVLGCLTVDLPYAFYIVGLSAIAMYVISISSILNTEEFQLALASIKYKKAIEGLQNKSHLE